MMASYNYTLGVVVDEVEQIERTILHLEQAMHHTSPDSIDALRRTKEQLDQLFQFIMGQEVVSHLSLPNMLTDYKECLQDCIKTVYSGKKGYMGRTRK
jgi:hypothetical protein